MVKLEAASVKDFNADSPAEKWIVSSQVTNTESIIV